MTRPLWPWEKQSDAISELEHQFCHKVGSALIAQIPVLAENDWKCKLKHDEFMSEFYDEGGQKKSIEDVNLLFTYGSKGLPKIFLTHGIFPLIHLFTERELKMLYLQLCLAPAVPVKQTFFLRAMQISRTYVSTMLKKFVEWRLFLKFRTAGVVEAESMARGKAKGRQLGYVIHPNARERLDKDLSEFDFFRTEVYRTVRPIALCFSGRPWRRDLGLLDREK